MQLHQLKPFHKSKKRKRIGRGGKRGTYSGRGAKGQRSRAGARIRPALRDFIKKIPKKRGIGFKKLREKIEIVNIEDLNKKFKEGEKITSELLLEKKMVKRIKGKIPLVKILGKGNPTKKLLIEGCGVSKGAKDKIEKAGGSVQ